MTTLTVSGVMDQLVIIQGALAITSPATASIKKAWKYFPPRRVTIRAALPATMNEFTLSDVGRHVALRVVSFQVHTQFVIADLDTDKAADLANGFLDQYLTTLDGKITLNGSCTTHSIRGGSPTLAVIQRGEENYIGLDLLMDVELKEAQTFAG